MSKQKRSAVEGTGDIVQHSARIRTSLQNRMDRGAWVKAPVALLYSTLSAVACRVWLAIRDHQGKNDCAWVGQKTLGKEIGSSPRTIGKAIKQLVAAGWLKVKKRHGDTSLCRVVVPDAEGVSKECPATCVKVAQPGENKLPTNNTHGTTTTEQEPSVTDVAYSELPRKRRREKREKTQARHAAWVNENAMTICKAFGDRVNLEEQLPAVRAVLWRVVDAIRRDEIAGRLARLAWYTADTRVIRNPAAWWQKKTNEFLKEWGLGKPEAGPPPANPLDRQFYWIERNRKPKKAFASIGDVAKQLMPGLPDVPPMRSAVNEGNGNGEQGAVHSGSGLRPGDCAADHRVAAGTEVPAA